MRAARLARSESRLGESWATGTPARRIAVRDLNDDGRSDLLITFRTARLLRDGNLAPGMTEITLWGMDESAGEVYKGTMTVTVIP
ncbi:MAG: hypothetical protein ACR2H9_14600 [Longimicrobiaceae bacterium]|jgi:hypothetical protein